MVERKNDSGNSGENSSDISSNGGKRESPNYRNNNSGIK
jgi:hypothetical protein